MLTGSLVFQDEASQSVFTHCLTENHSARIRTCINYGVRSKDRSATSKQSHRVWRLSSRRPV